MMLTDEAGGYIAVPVGTTYTGKLTPQHIDFLRRLRRPDPNNIVMSIAVETTTVSEGRDAELLPTVVRGIATIVTDIRYVLRFDLVFIVVIADSSVSGASNAGVLVQDTLREAGIRIQVGITRPLAEAGLDRPALRALAAGELSRDAGAGVYLPTELARKAIASSSYQWTVTSTYIRDDSALASPSQNIG